MNVVSISKMRESKEITKCRTETHEAKRLREFLYKHRWEDNNKTDVPEIEHHIRARMEFMSYKIPVFIKSFEPSCTDGCIR